jgi:hypothetical protein
MEVIALSALESMPSGPVYGLTCTEGNPLVPRRPLVAGVNGRLMARRSSSKDTERDALITCV